MSDTSHRLLLSDQFLPKLITVFREGYRLGDLRADALAGLTVAIVALPLSMAIAIASGVGPERGLYTAIVGGFLVSALGGSRFQVGGPAGAFIVLVSACVLSIGLPGLILATFLSGALLIGIGVLRLGSAIRFIPYPVTVGFTAGIAVIIFLSQMKDLFGLTLTEAEPADVVGKAQALWAARPSATPLALVVALGTVAVILGLRRWRPKWPGLLIAVALAALTVALLDLPVETIASRFGALPRVLPAPALPAFGMEAVRAALPWAVSFALLGAIESLLSAVVADGMTGRRHRSNAELVAQGVANIGSALFGGFCVTGTIARTATNVRAGSRGPISGMLHALFLLIFLMVAAPLAGFIPLAALAGLLVVVAWNMAEKAEFLGLLRASRGDAAVVLVTFLLVVFRDLTEGIAMGAGLCAALFLYRLAGSSPLQPGEGGVFRLQGPVFFGTVARLGSALEALADPPRAVVLELTGVPFLDSSAAHALAQLSARIARQGGRLRLSGANPPVAAALRAQGLDPDAA